MTWSKITKAPTFVSAFKSQDGEQDVVQVSVGTCTAFLSLEDAGSLGGYLLQFAPDQPEPTPEPQPGGVTPA